MGLSDCQKCMIGKDAWIDLYSPTTSSHAVTLSGGRKPLAEEENERLFISIPRRK